MTIFRKDQQLLSGMAKWIEGKERTLRMTGHLTHDDVETYDGIPKRDFIVGRTSDPEDQDEGELGVEQRKTSSSQRGQESEQDQEMGTTEYITRLECNVAAWRERCDELILDSQRQKDDFLKTITDLQHNLIQELEKSKELRNQPKYFI
mgnify:CR=1 FL=1